MFSRIRKRDGSIVKFDSSKITIAITKAGKVTGEFGKTEAKKLTHRVLDLAYELDLGSLPDVEGNGMPRRLPAITLDNGKTYFIDERLKQLRNVHNPHDFINW